RTGPRDREVRSVRLPIANCAVPHFSFSISCNQAISFKSAIGDRQSAMILSGWETVFFWIFSIAAILAVLLTCLLRTAVHAALFLISSLVSVAALFILLGAEFIAGVQILVYVGGVMVLFLFVIMLVNVGAEEEGKAAIFNRPAQVTTAMVFLALLAGIMV